MPEIIKQKKTWTAIIIDINKNLILGDPSQIEAKENHVLEVKQTVAVDNKNSVKLGLQLFLFINCLKRFKGFTVYVYLRFTR